MCTCAAEQLRVSARVNALWSPPHTHTHTLSGTPKKVSLDGCPFFHDSHSAYVWRFMSWWETRTLRLIEFAWLLSCLCQTGTVSGPPGIDRQAWENETIKGSRLSMIIELKGVALKRATRMSYFFFFLILVLNYHDTYVMKFLKCCHKERESKWLQSKWEPSGSRERKCTSTRPQAVTGGHTTARQWPRSLRRALGAAGAWRTVTSRCRGRPAS